MENTQTVKHTPGPWKALKTNDSNYYIIGPAGKKSDGTKGSGIAPVVSLHQTWFPDYAEVNAALIAAAPELLEALKLAEATISLEKMYMEVCQEQYDKHLAQISRAFGEDVPKCVLDRLEGYEKQRNFYVSVLEKIGSAIAKAEGRAQ